MSELKDLVLHKIGRNVVNFQKIEGMLKLLVSHSNFKCPISKFGETLDARRKKFEKQSMGSVIREYFKQHIDDTTCGTDVSEDRQEPWISLSLSRESKKEVVSQEKTTLAFLVSERNRLIHHMLIGFNSESEENCNSLIVELDKQNEMIQREYTNMQNFLKTYFEAYRELLK